MENQKQKKILENGILNLSKRNLIKRAGKPNVFNQKLKKNLTKYLFDFFFYKELLNICPTNIFIHNCFSEYELSSWEIEINNIIDIFELDIKNIKEEIGESLIDCIKKDRLYKMLNYEGNYIKINNEGINIISSVYNDPDMTLQLNKLNNNINNNLINSSLNSFDSFELFNEENENNRINPKTLKTPWEIIHCDNSYNKGNIIYLEEKSPLDFGFSFNNVIKGNYKFYLHQSITNMKNAKLILQVTINDTLVYEINDFPNKDILSQFEDDDNKINIDKYFGEDEDIEITKFDNINLKETFICEITEEMFDKVNKKKTSLFESKNTSDSLGSTESNTSINSSSNKSDKNFASKIKKYNIRVRFTNQHLFWKAGWYLDGGKLVKIIREN